MAKSYADYLRENGATDEEVKVLDVPSARKAYDSMVKAAADAAADAADKSAKLTAYDKWYNEVAEPTAAQLKAERDIAKADAEAERARLKELQTAGLVKMEAAKETPVVATPAFDPKAHNLVTTDTLRQVANMEGDAIAIMADIQDEHRELFGTRINARELRKEAVAANKSLEEIWMQKYGVQAAREKKAAESKAAYEKKIADEAIAKYRSENENPLTRPATASSNPFVATKRTGTDGGNVLPWQGSQSDRSNERVNKALQGLQQKGII
jgi:peptidyl-tRNA hydrolase